MHANGCRTCDLMEFALGNMDICPDEIENICYFEICHWETCPLEDNIFAWRGLGLLVIQQGVTDFVGVRSVHYSGAVMVGNHGHSVSRPVQESYL